MQHVTPDGVRLGQAVRWSGFTTIVVFILGFAHLLPHAPDEFTYDWRTAIWSDRAVTQRSDIALIFINDRSIARYPSRSPVDRGLLAALVRALDRAEARLIGLDFAFDRHSVPSRDDDLVAAIKASRTDVVLAVTNEREGPLDPADLKWQCEFVSATGRQAGTMFLGEQKRTAFTLGDNVVRTMGMPDQRGYDCNGQTYRYDRTFDMLLAGPGRRFPDNRLIAWLLPPNNAIDTFATIYIHEHDPVETGDDGRTVLPDYLFSALKGKIVIVGGDFLDRDQHRVPMSVDTGAPVAGAFIHAQIVAQLRDGRAIKELYKLVELIIIFAVCFVGFLLSSRYFLFSIELFAELVFLLSVVVVGILMFSLFKIVLPTSTIFLGWLLGAIGGSHYDKMVSIAAMQTRRLVRQGRRLATICRTSFRRHQQ